MIALALILLSGILSLTSCGNDDSHPSQRGDLNKAAEIVQAPVISISEEAPEAEVQTASAIHGVHHSNSRGPINYRGRNLRWGQGYWNLMGYGDQRGYFEALRIKARAALVKAEAEARLNNQRTAAKIEEINAIKLGLQNLAGDLAVIAAKQNQLGKAMAVMDKMTFDGKTDGALAAIRKLSSIAEIPVSEILKIKVDQIAESEFSSRGRFRAVELADGRRVIKKNVTTAFGGGNMLEYLSFLQEQRQDAVQGGAAHSPLIALGDELARLANEKLASLGNDKDRVLNDIRTRYKDLETIAEKSS